MGRYVKQFRRVGMSLGPSEERGFAMWVGYEIPDHDDDLSALGLTCIDTWPDEEVEKLGVATFVLVAPTDVDLRRKLGMS